jgi:hypothetical protein
MAQEYQQVAQQLAELNVDEQTITDTLQAMRGEFTQHIIELTKVYRDLESSAQAIHEAEKSMAQRRYRYEARAQRIKEYVLQTLLNTGLKKVECPEFEISLRNNPPHGDHRPAD